MRHKLREDEGVDSVQKSFKCSCHWDDLYRKKAGSGKAKGGRVSSMSEAP